MAVPRFPWAPEALRRGDTLRRPARVHRVNDPLGRLERQRAAGSPHRGRGAGRRGGAAGRPPAARRRTATVLGHERTGIPAEAADLLGLAVEIPMVGSGSGLDVAVAGSLVLYGLAGLP